MEIDWKGKMPIVAGMVDLIDETGSGRGGDEIRAIVETLDGM